jgi:hypothetical protein
VAPLALRHSEADEGFIANMTGIIARAETGFAVPPADETNFFEKLLPFRGAVGVE